MYSGYIQFFMIVMVFLNDLQAKHAMPLLTNHPVAFMVVGFLVFLIVSIVVGRLDYKLGFFSEEARRHSETNPVMQDIVKLLEEIKSNQK